MGYVDPMTPWVSAYFALDGRLTVLDVGGTDGGGGDGAWVARVRAECPDARLEVLARDAVLDRACAERGLRHVNYLRIADEAAAMPVLLGARRLLSHARIDLIEIVGEPTAAIGPMVSLLQPFDYMLLPPSPQLNDLLLRPFGEDAARAILLGLNRRFQSAIEAKREPDLGGLMTAHKLTPRGIVHIGAHEGQEVPAYLARGFAPVLLIEAEPHLAAALTERFRDDPRVSVVACAIADFDGSIDLHVTSSTASSSILALEDHAAIFPDIVETGQVRVPARTLDGLLAEHQAGEAFNIAIVDVQGAELQVLRGAAGLLSRLDGVLVEVNFSEVYRGCAQIEQIDDHLAGFGFVRVMTMSPYKSNFGDAFYCKTALR
jgi:FkbM family methyltransferase